MDSNSGEPRRPISEKACLPADREAALAAVKKRGLALADASEALRDDREIVLAAVAKAGGALEYASERLRDDREVVLAAVNQWGPAFRHASERLRGDAELALSAVARLADCGERLSCREKLRLTDYLAPPLAGSKDFFREAARVFPGILEDAPEELRSDCGFVLELLGRCREAPIIRVPCGVWERPSIHRTIVLAIAPGAWESPGFLEEIFRNHPWSLKYAPPEYRQNDELIRRYSSGDGSILQYASESLQNDRDFFIRAVRRNSGTLKYASERLRDDPEIAEAALASPVKRTGFYKYLSPGLRDDKELLLKALKAEPDSLRYASERLRGDPETAAAAWPRRKTRRCSTGTCLRSSGTTRNCC